MLYAYSVKAVSPQVAASLRSNYCIYRRIKEKEAKHNGGQHKTEDGSRNRLRERMFFDVNPAPDNER